MKNGAEHIQTLIQRGIDNGTRRAIVIGDWEIERAIRIPSNFQLVLDDCHLKMADDTFDNMFVNEHYGTDECRTISGTDRNISLIGRGNAILDGGTYNGLSEKNSRKDGMPPIYKNNTILFNNVDGFEIRGIALHNFRWWAMNFIYCANGEITDITLKADDTCIDNDGNVYHGLSLINYYDMLIKQADGIDIRQGCHHILIENIHGFAGDDSVAITALDGKMEQEHAVEGLPKELHHIKVKNINTEALSSNVRLLNMGGYAMHDILVDGVNDISDTTDHLNDHGMYGIHIGDVYDYGKRQPYPEEMYNIVVRNVRSRADYAMNISCNMKNFVYENIIAFDGAGYIEDFRKLNK